MSKRLKLVKLRLKTPLKMKDNLIGTKEIAVVSGTLPDQTVRIDFHFFGLK